MYVHWHCVARTRARFSPGSSAVTVSHGSEVQFEVVHSAQARSHCQWHACRAVTGAVSPARRPLSAHQRRPPGAVTRVPASGFASAPQQWAQLKFEPGQLPLTVAWPELVPSGELNLAARPAAGHTSPRRAGDSDPTASLVALAGPTRRWVGRSPAGSSAWRRREGTVQAEGACQSPESAGPQTPDPELGPEGHHPHSKCCRRAHSKTEAKVTAHLASSSDW